MNLERVLLLSFGIVYLWFGALKFFPGVSPAEVLAGETIHLLSVKTISAELGVRLLAILETLIGIACILGTFPKLIIRLIIFHMLCTFSPIFLMPDQFFGEHWFSLTLVGQYIIKNIVFVSALLLIYNQISARQKGNQAKKRWSPDSAPVTLSIASRIAMKESDKKITSSSEVNGD